MKSYVLLLSLTVCCFVAIECTVGEPQHQLQDCKHAISAASQPLMKATGTDSPHCGAKFKQAWKLCGECGKTIA